MCTRDTEADCHFLVGVTQNYLQRYLLCQYAQKGRDREIKDTDRWTLLMIKRTGRKKSFRYDTLLDLDVCAGKEEASIPKSAWTQDRCWHLPTHSSHHAPTSRLKIFRNQFLLCSCTVCVCSLVRLGQANGRPEQKQAVQVDKNNSKINTVKVFLNLKQ